MPAPRAAAHDPFAGLVVDAAVARERRRRAVGRRGRRRPLRARAGRSRPARAGCSWSSPLATIARLGMRQMYGERPSRLQALDTIREAVTGGARSATLGALALAALVDPDPATTSGLLAAGGLGHRRPHHPAPRPARGPARRALAPAGSAASALIVGAGTVGTQLARRLARARVRPAPRGLPRRRPARPPRRRRPRDPGARRPRGPRANVARHRGQARRSSPSRRRPTRPPAARGAPASELGLEISRGPAPVRLGQRPLVRSIARGRHAAAGPAGRRTRAGWQFAVKHTRRPRVRPSRSSRGRPCWARRTSRASSSRRARCSSASAASAGTAASSTS